jgi:hypothetical protein
VSSTRIVKPIARAETCEFWQIGTAVYRVKSPDVRDVYGVPADRRWECTRSHWDHYRAVYSFAQDVAEPAVALAA